MISCDEFQEKIVAFFDHEASEEDAVLISAHLKQCPECRAFQEDMVRMGEEFLGVAFPSLPPEVEQKVMREAAADRLEGKISRRQKGVTPEPSVRRFPRLAWASGLISFCLLVLACSKWVFLSREVAHLRSELQVAQRDAAIFRAEKHLREVRDRQEREQKDITALYLRMGQLEGRLDQAYPSRTAFVPTGRGSL